LFTNSLNTSFKLLFWRFWYIYNKNANEKYPQLLLFKSWTIKLLNNKWEPFFFLIKSIISTGGGAPNESK
jgi:hypothetical protein